MGRRAGLCLLAVLFFGRACALDAIVWHTQFRVVEVSKNELGDTYIEIYWQVIPTSLHYSKQDEKWRSAIKADIVFKNDMGIVAQDHLNLRTAPANSLADAQQQNITDLHRYKLPEGKINIDLKLSEPGYPANVYSYSDSFTVENHNGIFYSGLQLIDTAYKSEAVNMFSKNGKQHIPLCTNFLDNYHSVLHYYTELYQAGMLGENEYPLVQRVFISKKEYEAPVYGLMHTDSIKRGTVLPIYGDFAISVLASGNYYLNTVLEDRSGQRLAANSYYFQRENKKPTEVLASQTKRDSAMEQVVVIDVSKSFVMKYTLPQLLAILKMITPISDALEQRAIKGFQKKPDEMYIRYFIYNFWTARNKKEPESEWKKYAERVKEVNKLFNAGSAPGYETDRGVIYLKYGRPDERVPVENEAGALPYEIWEYKVLGKLNQEGVFLFYKPAELVNDYRLLHSTLNNETKNPNWRSYLYISNSSGNNNTNSRAEQYIRNR